MAKKQKQPLAPGMLALYRPKQPAANNWSYTVEIIDLRPDSLDPQRTAVRVRYNDTGLEFYTSGAYLTPLATTTGSNDEQHT